MPVQAGVAGSDVRSLISDLRETINHRLLWEDLMEHLFLSLVNW